MSYSVALAGKGGSGKTTMAGMLIKYLLQKIKITSTLKKDNVVYFNDITL